MTITEVTVDELAAAIARGAVVIDVREPDEFAEARVPDAVLVPLATVPENIERFKGEDTTYVICRSGARSMHACQFVAEHGANVVNVAGGTMAWIESGREIVSGAA